MVNTKFWDNIGYLILVLLLIGQITVGWAFFIGQGAYLIGNIINLVRDFKLDRPKADKIKNTCFTAITMGLIIIKLI
jgi:hypothetical protein